MHRSGGLLVVEIEPDPRDPSLTPLSHRATQAAVTHLAATTTVRDLAQALASQIRILTGHDRVMVYRFDEEWNGEVIAEDRREDLSPSSGCTIRRPTSRCRRGASTDRQLDPGDRGHRVLPVPQHPVFDPATDGRWTCPTRRCGASRRSTSSTCQHMGVTASMSISLMVDGRLWGLVACHHYGGPRRPFHDARSAAEFLGQVASQLAGTASAPTAGSARRGPDRARPDRGADDGQLRSPLVSERATPSCCRWSTRPARCCRTTAR